MTLDHSTEAYKAYFLGPKAENEAWMRSEFQSILEHWFQWRKNLFPTDQPVSVKSERRTPAYLDARERMVQGLEELTELLEDEVPKFTPRYVGHMVSELTLPSLMGHFAMLLHNPNNTSRDASKVGQKIEAEVIAMLAEMMGFDPGRATGHITGGGTVANFEAVWRARFRQDHWLSLALYLAEERGVKLGLFQAAHMGWKRFGELLAEHSVVLDDLRGYSGVATNPYEFGERMTRAFGQPYRGPVMLVPENKHFSWTKATNIFGYGEHAFWPIALDARGKMDVASLEAQIARARAEGRPVAMVVSVAGTTETGEIDPVDRVQAVLDRARAEHGLDIWHHVDAAYGGFLCSLLRGKPSDVLSEANAAALGAIGQAHSVTIDPHKLGYVPYSCGAIITKDEQAYAVSSFKAPYLERQLEVPDKWSTTLEGSRSAAGAAAAWLTGKTMGFDTSGLGGVIAETILACRAFKARVVGALPFVRPLDPSETNILCFSLAEEGMSLKASNAATEAVFDRFVACPEFSVSKTTLSGKAHAQVIARHVESHGGTLDDDRLVLIRCVFMNPFWREQAVAERLTADIIEHLRGWFRPAKAA